MNEARHVQAFTAEWPRDLKSAQEAARSLGISADRLIGLADGGFAPHYRIDGGPPQFKLAELKGWASTTLVSRCKGRELPEPIRVVVAAPPPDLRKVPPALREIPGLADITDAARRTGIYFLCRDGVLLYVGQSINAYARVAEHTKYREFDSAFFLPWPADDLNRIEAALIRTLTPPLNGRLPNGKMRVNGYQGGGPSRGGAADDDAPLLASIGLSPQTEPAQLHNGASAGHNQ
jgi:hypothetical protein